jgi:lysophospholipase L1-like esterase
MRANRVRNCTRALIVAAALLPGLLLPAAASAQVDTGSADFTRYVALGDSLTAGFQSASLYVGSQSNSYPALIKRQTTGSNSGFQQPLVSEPGIPGKLVLRTITAGGIPIITPEPGLGSPTNLTAPAYQNLAVPGADVNDLVASTASAGGLHQLILRDPRFTALQQALAQQPTFVTLWIGNNDALAAATSGIVNDQTLTPLPLFVRDFLAATAAIAGTGAEMAIANIPDVTTIPFVTTVSRFVTLPNGVVFNLIGPNGQPVGPNDFVLLSAAAEIATGLGIPTQIGGRGPLADSHVLNAAEVAAIRARVADFNAIIRGEATARGAAFVDANSQLTELATRGLNVGGINLTTAFLTGGIFSYDGVHPSTIGYGVVANGFIDAINEQFDAEIPQVNLAALMFAPGALAASVGKVGGGNSGGYSSGQLGPADFESLLPFYFSPQAWTNLRWALRIPSPAELEKPPQQPRRPRRRGPRG